MQELRTLSTQKQLIKLNLYLNGLQAQFDDVIHKKEENWATPKEFLSVGFGDCEDYAIIKYYSLIELGFSKERLYLTIVKENFRGGQHMVLSYFEKQGQAPLILDNLSFKVLPLNKRKDLSAEYFINEYGVYTMRKNGTLEKSPLHFKEFEELRKRIEKGL